METINKAIRQKGAKFLITKILSRLVIKYILPTNCFQTILQDNIFVPCKIRFHKSKKFHLIQLHVLMLLKIILEIWLFLQSQSII